MWGTGKAFWLWGLGEPGPACVADAMPHGHRKPGFWAEPWALSLHLFYCSDTDRETQRSAGMRLPRACREQQCGWRLPAASVACSTHLLPCPGHATLGAVSMETDDDGETA